MTVHTLDPLADPRWSELVRDHPLASVFHRTEWLRAVQRTYGYEPVVYTTTPPGIRLTNGVVFCRVRSWLTGHRLVSLPFADHCEPLVERMEDRSAIAQGLQAAAWSEWRYVELRPRTRDLTAGGFVPDVVFHFHTVDLDAPLDGIYARFHKSTIQRKIRRAERERIRCESGRSPRLLQAFYALTIMTRRRHGLAPQPLRWFENLIESFGPDLTISIAYSGDRAVAGMLTLRHGHTVVYKYGCSDARVHNLGAMPLLFWETIKAAHRAGATALDLGRSDAKQVGLATFKERLGGVRSTLTYLRCASGARPGSRWPGRMWARAFAYMPTPVLVSAGRFFYRYLG